MNIAANVRVSINHFRIRYRFDLVLFLTNKYARKGELNEAKKNILHKSSHMIFTSSLFRCLFRRSFIKSRIKTAIDYT